MKARTVLILALIMLALTVSGIAQRKKKDTGQRQPANIRLDVAKEKVGRESVKFVSVVGNWSIIDDGGRYVLAVDGRQWSRGQPAGGLAQKARAIYGARNEERPAKAHRRDGLLLPVNLARVFHITRVCGAER